MPVEIHFNKRGTAVFTAIGGTATNLRVASSDEAVVTLGATSDPNNREVRPQSLGDATLTATYNGRKSRVNPASETCLIYLGESA